MSEINHTPGPWTVGGLDRNAQRIVRGSNLEIATCWHHNVATIEEQMEANARLIAAAPDLLGIVELIDDTCGDQLYTMARAALAKAKGTAS